MQNSHVNEEVHYSEVQRPPRAMIITMSTIGLVVFALVITVVMLEANNTEQPELVHFLWWLLCTPLAFVFLAWMRMSVTITAATVVIKMKWLQWRPRVISAAGVRSVDIRRGSAFGEFGGWGIRYSIDFKKKGYVLQGDYLLELTLNTGKKVVITVNDCEALRNAVAVFSSNISKP